MFSNQIEGICQPMKAEVSRYQSYLKYLFRFRDSKNSKYALFTKIFLKKSSLIKIKSVDELINVLSNSAFLSVSSKY